MVAGRIDRNNKRALSLFGLGFSYDTELEIFLRQEYSDAPIIVTKAFIVGATNEVFFREFYKIREMLKGVKDACDGDPEDRS